MTSRALAVVYSQVRARIRCPLPQVSLPEFYDKTAEINGLTILHLLFVNIRLCQTIHDRMIMG